MIALIDDLNNDKNTLRRLIWHHIYTLKIKMFITDKL